MNTFIKSYETDYTSFKKKYKDAGLSIMDAKNDWRYLLGSNKVLKKKALERIKSYGIGVRNLSTLSSILR